MIDPVVATLVTAAALVGVAAVGLVYSRRHVGSIEDLVTARNSAGTGLTTATLVASGLGAWVLFSPAEAGAAFGGLAAVVGYGIGSTVPVALFIWVGARVRRYIPEGHSLTEYVYVRYGPVFYVYVLLISVSYMFVFLAAEMTGIVGALRLVADVPAWWTATLVGGVALVYTAYGGLLASIVTDAVQAVVLLPLIVVTAVAAAVSLGGVGTIVEGVAASQPQLLDITHGPGVEFGAYITVAILGANMFNQGRWQRIYAAHDERTVRRSFALSAAITLPAIVLFGLFGVVAAGLGLGDDPSTAFFAVVDAALPDVLLLGVVALAAVLVASTADTLFNAIASIATADLSLVADDPDERTLLFVARGLTVLVALGAVVVGTRGYSVLDLFLLADLLSAATVVPFLYGLFSDRATEGGAIAGSVAGLAVGTAYFPLARGLVGSVPVVGPALPPASNIHAFTLAIAVSAAVVVALARLTDGRFDRDRLAARIRSLDAPDAAPADD
ncbi:MAG: sodium:proline symporter [Haloferacaceae archaeon]